MPRQLKPDQPVKLRRSSSKSELRRSNSVKSTGGRRDSVTSPQAGFMAKVTCWQQRIDPEAEVNLKKRQKQRPVSIAGEAGEIVGQQEKGGGLKKVPSLGSIPAIDGVNGCMAP